MSQHPKACTVLGSVKAVAASWAARIAASSTAAAIFGGYCRRRLRRLLEFFVSDLLEAAGLGVGLTPRDHLSLVLNQILLASRQGQLPVFQRLLLSRNCPGRLVIGLERHVLFSCRVSLATSTILGSGPIASNSLQRIWTSTTLPAAEPSAPGAAAPRSASASSCSSTRARLHSSSLLSLPAASIDSP